MPRSCLFLLPVNVADAMVSIAVVPPKAISQPVDMANMYAKAAVAKASGDSRPTIKTEIVCNEFCSVYARMTGTEVLSNIHCKIVSLTLRTRKDIIRIQVRSDAIDVCHHVLAHIHHLVPRRSASEAARFSHPAAHPRQFSCFHSGVLEAMALHWICRL